MKLVSKLLNRQERKCLICEKRLGKNFAEVKYSYEGGVGTAFICSGCGDGLEKNRLERENDNDLAV